MSMSEWNKISYMVQLIAACFLFMVPCRKRPHFVLRFVFCSAVLCLVSYAVNSRLSKIEGVVFSMLYWAAYLLICVLLNEICLEMNLLSAFYWAMCACAMQHVAFDMTEIYIILGGTLPAVYVVLYVAVYALFYFWFVKKLPEGGKVEAGKDAVFPLMTIISIVWVLSVHEMSDNSNFRAAAGSRLFYRLLDSLCCFYALWVQISQKEKLALRRELEGINKAWEMQKNQYKIKQELIDNINRKCHDLKHQIRALRKMGECSDRDEYLKEIENDVMLYDTAVDTGNKALDVILMDKGLYCKEHEIQLTCMADGSRLEFMKLEDIYAIFGNALENAITAVMEFEDKNKRVVSLKMITQNNIMVIQVQNYYKTRLKFEHGLPLTTKENRMEHGYGMKSMRYIAEKYNGTLTANTDGDIFNLQIMVPLGGKRAYQ